jgi:sugar (pentulose or hexulose) kinase
MSKDVVLIFDIGKTNKKIQLFDRQLQVIHEEEQVFEEIPDDDGFAGDDIERLEAWILNSCNRYLDDADYIVRGINFTTYGASLMYLDSGGQRLTPVYNYLKPMPDGVVERIYDNYGGIEEFCRTTASPSLGMLNSGFQALWLQQNKPAVFNKVKTILHFPQYLCHFLTGKPSAEHTSIGCHTAMWDFDKMRYHEWTRSLGNVLPNPEPVETVYPSSRLSKKVPVGIGIHDSSSSLVPYFMKSDEAFILLSTGTWCISMNPFNHSPLTPDQLQKDCLAYLSVKQEPVKASRLFMGHIHDVNVRRLSAAFGLEEEAYKNVGLDHKLLSSLNTGNAGTRVFFKNGVPEEFIDNSVDTANFKGFEEAYHQFMIDLTDLTVESISLIIENNDRTRNLYITGGFSKNPIFRALIENRYPEMRVYPSEIPNASSLGAALVLWKALESESSIEDDINKNHTGRQSHT